MQTTLPSPPAAVVTAPAQRSHGRLEVELAPEGRLVRLHQAGCAKAFLPRVHSGTRELVIVNTAGGMTGGDRLDIALALRPGATLCATSQTAERVYRAAQGAAKVGIRLDLGAGAALDWLPQETILFDSSRLDRRMRADIAADARFLLCDMLVLGRRAMGEVNISARVSDRRELRRAGRVVHLDRFHADLPLADRRGSALLGGAAAMALVVLIAPDAVARLAAARAALPDGPATGGADIEAAVSAWDGRLVARLCAHRPAALRATLVPLFATLSHGPVPRGWAC